MHPAPPLAASAALSVFVPPPPTTLRVCATAREAAVEEVARFAGAPAGMRRAAVSYTHLTLPTKA